MNGTCNTNTSTCIINSWCPVENDSRSGVYISNFLNFTVLIKNYIFFPSFPDATPKHAHRNVKDVDQISPDFLKNCRYDPTEVKTNQSILFCPIFSLRTLLTDPEMINDNTSMDVGSLVEQGGVIDINIHWQCNLDFSIDNCNPQYQTRRLDQGNVSISPGYNFRKADYSYENEGSNKYRYLYKLYGIKFNIVVSGIARQFDLYQLFITIGSGIAYFALATIITDFFILWIYKKRKLYRKEKYQSISDVEDPDLLTRLLAGRNNDEKPN